MTLPKYKPDRRYAAAHILGIEEQYLYQILRGIRIPSPSLARKINQYDKKISLKDLRPNDWREIWPDQVAKSSKKIANKNVIVSTAMDGNT